MYTSVNIPTRNCYECFIIIISASSSMNEIVPHEIAMNIRQLNKSTFKLEFIIKILLLSYHNDDVNRYSVFTFQIE